MKNAIKNFLAKRGYHIFKEGFTPKGFSFESDLSRVVELDKFELAMDVGGFHGLMTKIFLNIFPKANVITVEPSIHSFNFLKKEFDGNTRVTVENCGAGKEETVINFKLFENGELNSFKSIGNDEAEAVEMREVPVHTVEYLLKNAGGQKKSIDFLKIDVEGFEMEVLYGANNLFDNTEIGCIFIEAGFCEDDERHTMFSSINDYLKTKGFSFYALYDLYHYRKSTELLFANALFLNEKYLIKKKLLKQ